MGMVCLKEVNYVLLKLWWCFLSVVLQCCEWMDTWSHRACTPLKCVHRSVLCVRRREWDGNGKESGSFKVVFMVFPFEKRTSFLLFGSGASMGAGRSV